MRFPKMKPRAALELKIPDLAGGMNLRDGLSEVLDNQLTDCKNMWWNDGVLKTRPGMRATKETVMYINRPTAQTVNIRNFPEIKYVKSNKDYYLQVIQRAWDIEHNGNYTVCLQFAWQNENEKIPLSYFNLNNDSEEINYFVCCKKDTLYCFTSKQTIHKLDITNTDSQWEKVKEEDYYAPLVVANCKTPAGSSEYDIDSDILMQGDYIEGYNILSKYYKMTYSSVNLSKFEGVSDLYNQPATYELLHPVVKGKKVKVKAKWWTNSGGPSEDIKTFIHEVIVNDVNVWSYESYDSNKPPEDGVYMGVKGRTLVFYECNKDLTQKMFSKIDYIDENNLEIIAPYTPSDENYNKFFNMTRCAWFGGASTGLEGGTRLFLCGNNGEDKSLVMWSGLNNPLYFSENSYFYVGDTTSAVTGFGKQLDMLVIFKENETWYTKYQQNTNITAKNVINQSVIDYEASSVYFPLVQINSSIGCSYPDTIQLCRNRLVWLGDNGNVYTLVSESQYNERSIFCVSEMVKKRLNKQFGISKPTACDWNGYYCLCFDKDMYLMDYNCYGYTHIASYSKTEDANIRIPWYFWEFDISGAICVIGDKIIFSYYHDSERYTHCAIVNNVLAADYESKDSICYEDWDNEGLLFTKRNIESKATTKLFDFGQPNFRKIVDKINLQLGNNGGEPIKVKIITECGEEEQEITLTGSEIQSYTPGYIDSKAIFPCIRQTVKMGLELSSNGVLAIDGMNIKYRTTGGTR